MNLLDNGHLLSPTEVERLGDLLEGRFIPGLLVGVFRPISSSVVDITVRNDNADTEDDVINTKSEASNVEVIEDLPTATLLVAVQVERRSDGVVAMKIVLASEFLGVLSLRAVPHIGVVSPKSSELLSLIRRSVLRLNFRCVFTVTGDYIRCLLYFDFFH